MNQNSLFSVVTSNFALLLLISVSNDIGMKNYRYLLTFSVPVFLLNVVMIKSHHLHGKT